MVASPYDGPSRPQYERGNSSQPTTPQQTPQHHTHSQIPTSAGPPLPTPQIQSHSQHSQQQSQSQSQSQLHQRSVKRPRPVKSCTECRKRKLRCDRLLPCSQCQKSNRSCKYAADQDAANLSDGSDAETSEPSRPTKRNYPPGAALTPTGSGADAPTSAPNAKNGEAGGLPILEELAHRMERLEKQVMVVRSPAGTDSSTTRITPAPPQTIRTLTIKDNCNKTRYFGQISPRVMMNLFYDARAFIAHQPKPPAVAELLLNYKALHYTLKANYRQALAPITVFVDSIMPVQKRMRDILPSKDVCDRLVQTYINTSEVILRILHVPTFYTQYAHFWEGKVLPESFLPQLLAVVTTASRFDTKSRGLGHERVEGVHLPTACALVRSWLDSLKGKQLIDFSNLQVELLLIHAQRMLTPRPHELWTQLGFIVRRAMTMGLHRDPSESEPRMPVFHGEMRRRLFYTILDLDLHNSLSSNLPSILREGDFTCRPPRNLDDAEIYEGMTELPPSRPIDHITDNQMQVHAATTLPTRMKVVHLVNRIDTIRDYQEVLEVGTKLDRYLEDINFIYPRQGVMDDAQRSKMWRFRVILDMHVRRPMLALYRSLALGAPDVPPQISRAYLRSCMVSLKYLDEIDPRLPHFADLSAMYHHIMKLDIIQCAYSVCYYIQSATRPSSENMLMGQQAMRMSPEAVDGYPTYAPDSLQLWSHSRLTNTVQKTIALLITHMSGSDTKDISSLIITLESVKRADPRHEDIVYALRGAFDNCLRATKLTMDQIHAGAQGHSDPRFHSDGYMRNHVPGNNRPAKPMSDFGSWIMWDGWDS